MRGLHTPFPPHEPYIFANLLEGMNALHTTHHIIFSDHLHMREREGRGVPSYFIPSSTGLRFSQPVAALSLCVCVCVAGCRALVCVCVCIFGRGIHGPGIPCPLYVNTAYVCIQAHMQVNA